MDDFKPRPINTIDVTEWVQYRDYPAGSDPEEIDSTLADEGLFLAELAETGRATIAPRYIVALDDFDVADQDRVEDGLRTLMGQIYVAGIPAMWDPVGILPADVDLETFRAAPEDQHLLWCWDSLSMIGWRASDWSDDHMVAPLRLL